MKEMIEATLMVTGAIVWAIGILFVVVFISSWIFEVLNNVWIRWKDKKHWLWHIEDTIKFPYTILRLRLLKIPNKKGLDKIKEWTKDPELSWFTRIKNPVNKLIMKYVELRIRRHERSLWMFMKSTPKNLWSIIIIWTMCFGGTYVMYRDSVDTETGWVIFTYSFLTFIAFIGWLRVYLLYKKNVKLGWKK